MTVDETSVMGGGGTEELAARDAKSESSWADVPITEDDLSLLRIDSVKAGMYSIRSDTIRFPK